MVILEMNGLSSRSFKGVEREVIRWDGGKFFRGDVIRLGFEIEVERDSRREGRNF